MGAKPKNENIGTIALRFDKIFTAMLKEIVDKENHERD